MATLEVSLFLLSLCHCHGQRNHEIAQGSQWGTLFSVTQRKSFVITHLKSYPVKIESNISSPHPLFHRQSSSLLSHIFLAFPFSLISYSFPLLPLFYAALDCLIWCTICYFDVISLEMTQELHCTLKQFSSFSFIYF